MYLSVRRISGGVIHCLNVRLPSIFTTFQTNMIVIIFSSLNLKDPVGVGMLITGWLADLEMTGGFYLLISIFL